jgi:XTP/dITP diphosphohydrolase
VRKLERGTRLVVASHNKGKVWEINQLILPYGLVAVSAADLGLAEPAEPETTFAGNALIKARAAAQGSGLPALADDSGLEIEVLGGAPGVYSADWAGPGKDFAIAMRRVHDELERRSAWSGKSAPRANFISVLCLAWPGGEHRFYTGRVHGRLTWPPRGGNGFGYDPIFIADGAQLTFGEMEPAAKYAISHRTRAFEAFRRECLEESAASAPAPSAVRDLAGLEAAAANISTKDELAAFIASLRSDIGRAGKSGGSASLSGLLAEVEARLADQKSTDEPKWRTIAKILLAASRTTE